MRSVRDLVGERTARDLERLLVAVNVAGALIAGWRHQPDWLGMMLVAFGAYVAISDRLLRRQIGDRAWPSEGYARFALNSNLYFAFKNLLLGTLLFFATGMVAQAIG